MYLIFDTETTGVPKDYNASPFDLDNWPRITQIAILVLDENFNVSHTYSELIKPDGWVVPKEKFFIDNNMSTERCEKYGYPVSKAIRSFIELVSVCDYVIAHNMKFDLNVLASEMIRAKISTTHKTTKICTMLSTIDFVGIKNQYGNKWPSLDELHRKLFNCGFDGAHDALTDVKATAKCFQKLKQENLINNWISK